MKVASINTVDYGSTGKIMLQIAQTCREDGIEAYTFSRKWNNNSTPCEGHKYFGYFFENVIHRTAGTTLCLTERLSVFGTKQLVKELKRISPDIIHLHNLHGWYINLSILMKYIKKSGIPVVWTLHDCWSFTGGCPYFTVSKCEKWKTGCFDCPTYKDYPQTSFDNTKGMWEKKKEWFSTIDNLTIVTPSQWLADLAKQSFLGNNTIKVINNGIDLSVFKPVESDFRVKHGCENKKIILGVSFVWGHRKGLDVFSELASRLDPEKYQIVLVGTSEAVAKTLDRNIICINKTNDQSELVQIYSTADVFVNPTREENYPTVNMEAIACGTPVITFATGGSPEILGDNCGSVVACDDIQALEQEIIRVCEENSYSQQDCIERAKSFDKNAKFEQYVELYKSLIDDNLKGTCNDKK